MEETRMASEIMITCGYERHVATVCKAQGQPCGVLVMWAEPFRVCDFRKGNDWVLIELSHGLSIAAVYTAPGDGGNQFKDHIRGWAQRGSRLMIMGDLNMQRNRRSLGNYLTDAGLLQVPSVPTTRGERVDREPTDTAFVTVPYHRMVVATPIMWEAFHDLSDYHWPVMFRAPKRTFVHPLPPTATWRSRMVKKLVNVDVLDRMELRGMLKSVLAKAPRPPPPTRLFGLPGSFTHMFYKSPAKFAAILRGGGEYAASDASLSESVRNAILRKTETRFRGNPEKGEYSDFMTAHIDPYYPRAPVWRSDEELMSPVSLDEVMGAFSELKDGATVDLALSALGELLEIYGSNVVVEYNAWIANGRCLDTWHIEISYIVTSKRGKLTADHHRVLALERATGKLFYKVLERRLRRVYEKTDILGRC